MQKESGFKHISVSEDEDEIVIQAGISSAASVGKATTQVSGEVSAEAVDDKAFFSDSDLSEEAREDIRHEAERARRAARAEANRMLTTEEDLKTKAPFSGMRRVILALAAILVLASVAYYWLAI